MTSVCRVCLASNTRLRSLENNLLINVYEKLSNTKFNAGDARPRALCCFCYQKLLKCHTFSQTACRSEKIYSQLLQEGLETPDYITEINLGMKHQLSIPTMQFVTIDGNATNTGSQLTIKDEPISNHDVKEEVIAEHNIIMIEVFKDCTKSQLVCKEIQSDQGNQIIIKDEPISSIDLKEEDKLVEVESEDCFKSQMTFEEDNTDQGNDVVMEELPFYTHVELIKPGVLKMQFCCNSCKKIFSTKRKIISHLRNSHLQHKEKQYSHKRKYTEKTGSNKDIIDKYQNKVFVCNVCDKQFSKNCHLYNHMSIHTGEKPFVCRVCNKQFRLKHVLVKHMKIHTGKKPFPCNVCDKQFRQKSTLVEHMRVHTGEKQFPCNVCDKQFRRKSTLVTHMRIHTGEKPFACNVCDKQFRQKCSLVEHMRVHTGEKPFACNVCDKQFRRKYYLVDHMRVHTGEKLFACDLCNKQFAQKRALVRHQKLCQYK